MLVKALDLLIHGINEQILLLLGLLEVADIFFGAVSRAARHRDLTLHDLVVFLNLLQSTIELVEFFLGLEDTLKLFISLFLLALVLTLEDLVLALSLRPVPLHDVVVVVGALEGSLHTGQLMLYTVQLHTSFLSAHPDLTDRLFGLAEFQIDALVLIRQLLGEGVLQARHQRLYK